MNRVAVPRLGVAFVPHLPPERLRSLARAADTGGLDDLWVWEDCFKQSGVATAATALAWTDRIRVGIGLLPAPLRNVAVAAMEIATLERMFPGRFVAGLGHGVQSWMGQAGARVDSPMTLLTEYTQAVRALLAGEEVTTQGRYVHLDRVRLDWPPATLPSLMLGGSGPKSLALAGRLGDGSMLGTGMTDDELAAACAIILDAAGASGAMPHEIIATQIVATGPGAQDRLDAEVVLWGKTPGQGVGVAGDAHQIAASIRGFVAAGATTVVIQSTQDEPDLEGLVAFIGGEVRALLTTPGEARDA